MEWKPDFNDDILSQQPGSDSNESLPATQWLCIFVRAGVYSEYMSVHFAEIPTRPSGSDCVYRAPNQDCVSETLAGVFSTRLVRANVAAKQVRQQIEGMKTGNLFVLLAMLFGLVHATYYFFGVHVSLPVSWDWHLIDPPLLEHRLLESVHYLHTQPPLWNLFVALFLTIPGPYQALLLTSFFLLLGFASYCCVFWLMKFMHTSTTVALILATLLMASPSFVLLEHGGGYDFLIVALLTSSVVVLWRFLNQPSYAGAFLFFLILAIICLTRSMFHLSYFVLVAMIVVLMNRSLYRLICCAALPGLLLVVSLYVKNYVVFGKFTASTWMGMNAAKVIIRSTPLAELKEWHEQGIISDVMLHEPWSDLSEYPERFKRIEEPFVNIPLLNLSHKESGYKNLHHVAYIAIADQYMADVLQVIRQKPLKYLRGFVAAWYCYFRATDESEFLPCRDACEGVINIYDYLFYGKSPWPIRYATDRKASYNLYVILIVALPLLFVYGVRLLTRKSELSREQKTMVAVMIFNIAFVALTINCFELAENQRARFYTDSFSLVLLAHFIHVRAWKSRTKRKDLRRKVDFAKP